MSYLQLDRQAGRHKRFQELPSSSYLMPLWRSSCSLAILSRKSICQGQNTTCWRLLEEGAVAEAAVAAWSWLLVEGALRGGGRRASVRRD